MGVTTGGCISVTGGGWGVGVVTGRGWAGATGGGWGVVTGRGWAGVTGWADELDWDGAAGRGIT